MEGKITLNPDDIVDNMDPFTDPKEAKNWVDCWDCGKPLYLGQYSNFVDQEYLPGGKLEQDGKTMWFCTSCWNMKKSKKKSTKLTKKVSPKKKRVLIGRKVKFTRNGKEFRGVIERVSSMTYGICCKPGKTSGELGSLYRVKKEIVIFIDRESSDSSDNSVEDAVEEEVPDWEMTPAQIQQQKENESKKKKTLKKSKSKSKKEIIQTQVEGFYYYIYSLPINDDNTINFEDLNKLTSRMKCMDILVLLDFSLLRKHFSNVQDQADYIALIDPFLNYMGGLLNFIESIPMIREEIKTKKYMCYNFDPKYIDYCNSCEENSVLRTLNREIHKIMGKVLHCDLALDVVNRVSQPIEMFPEIIFSMTENTLDILYNNLFTIDGNKLITLEESRLNLLIHSRPLAGAITSGGCFENSLRNLSEDVFSSNIIFEIDAEDTVLNNISNNMNILLHYLCKNSMDPNYNKFIKPWTPADKKFPLAIDWVLDHFDNQQGIINILKENNVIGRQCSDGIITEESVKETIIWLLELDALDEELPWLGKCDFGGVTIPCRKIREYRVAINNNCSDRKHW